MRTKDRSALEHILEEIDFISETTKGMSYDELVSNEDKKRSIAMTLINMGELARLLSKEIRAENTQIPFADIIGMRDVTAHGYKKLQFNFVWNTIKQSVPQLDVDIRKLLS